MNPAIIINVLIQNGNPTNRAHAKGNVETICPITIAHSVPTESLARIVAIEVMHVANAAKLVIPKAYLDGSSANQAGGWIAMPVQRAIVTPPSKSTALAARFR
jgi:hypothetical protein